MCDFSLQHAKSRPAVVADKLVTKDFGRGTRGFADVSECDTPYENSTAVCVLPGTEIAFDADVDVRFSYNGTPDKPASRVARFRQIDKDVACTHHDALEFATGEIIKLHSLDPGQRATVLQLPAQSKTEQEAQDQKRLEVVA